MCQNAGDVVHGELAHATVAVAREQGIAVSPDRLVGVHSRPVVAEDRLGHEGRGLAVSLGDVLHDVFVPLERIGHLHQRQEAQVDFGLSRGRHFVVMLLDPDADFLHGLDHFGPHVLEGIQRGHREVALFVAGFVAEVGALLPTGVPDPFDRIDVVVAFESVLVEADLVEDEELGLWAEVGHVAEAAGLDVSLGFLGDAARVARIGFAGNRIDDVAEQAERRLVAERVHDRGAGVGNHQHVRRVDRLPAADRGAVKARAVLEERLVVFAHGDREMLPRADQVHELQVHQFGTLFLRQGNGFLCGHTGLSSFTLTQSLFARPWIQSASSPRSPVRIRMTSSTLLTKILPSPMRPVLAAS